MWADFGGICLAWMRLHGFALDLGEPVLILTNAD